MKSKRKPARDARRKTTAGPVQPAEKKEADLIGRERNTNSTTEKALAEKKGPPKDPPADKATEWSIRTPARLPTMKELSAEESIPLVAGKDYEIFSSGLATLGERAGILRLPKVPPTITPFELFMAANSLAQGQPAHNYLPQAYAGLTDAAAFLEEMEKQSVVTFDEIIGKATAPNMPKSGNTKTLLSGITTREGLIKALWREIGGPEVSVMIINGSMTKHDLDLLSLLITRRRARSAKNSRKPATAAGPAHTRAGK